MKYKIPVTEKHTSPECVSGFTDCMFARALKDVFPDRKIRVGFAMANIDGIFIGLPKEVCDAIQLWCDDSPVKPFDAYIDIDFPA